MLTCAPIEAILRRDQNLVEFRVLPDEHRGVAKCSKQKESYPLPRPNRTATQAVTLRVSQASVCASCSGGTSATSCGRERGRRPPHHGRQEYLSRGSAGPDYRRAEKRKAADVPGLRDGPVPAVSNLRESKAGEVGEHGLEFLQVPAGLKIKRARVRVSHLDSWGGPSCFVARPGKRVKADDTIDRHPTPAVPQQLLSGVADSPDRFRPVI